MSEGFIYHVNSIDNAVDATLSGVAVVVLNISPDTDSFFQVAELLQPHFGQISALDEIQATEEQGLSIRLSLSEHPLHTDGAFEDSPPERFLLQFSEPDPKGGGKSTFLPIKTILEKMPDFYKQVLLERPVKFCHVNLDNTITAFPATVLFDRKDKLTLRYGTDKQVFIEPMSIGDADVIKALLWLQNTIENEEPLEYPAQKGDVLIVNNDLVLHGRTALSELGKERFIRRLYLGCESYFTGLMDDMNDEASR